MLYRLDLSNEQVTGVVPGGDVPIIVHQPDYDEEILLALGYRQDFKRKFNLWSSFCVSFSVLGLLPSIAATLAFSLGQGRDHQNKLIKDMPGRQGWCGVGLLHP